MQNTVYDGGEEYSSNTQKSNAAIERIERRKQFGAFRFHFHNGSHTGEDHAGHVETIEQTKITKVVIAKDT